MIRVKILFSMTATLDQITSHLKLKNGLNTISTPLLSPNCIPIIIMRQ